MRSIKREKKQDVLLFVIFLKFNKTLNSPQHLFAHELMTQEENQGS